MGLYDSQSSLCFPSFGITEIIASLHDGGSFPSLSVTLKGLREEGFFLKCNSLGNPSLPGSNSFLVMLETNFVLCFTWEINENLFYFFMFVH